MHLTVECDDGRRSNQLQLRQRSPQPQRVRYRRQERAKWSMVEGRRVEVAMAVAAESQYQGMDIERKCRRHRSFLQEMQ